jgi:hypothetical protein
MNVLKIKVDKIYNIFGIGRSNIVTWPCRYGIADRWILTTMGLVGTGYVLVNAWCA